jgi:UDP:flavonoid glycosyltransferase YjiC (YdhE family)
MKILLLPIGSYGDVHPFVGIGRGLQARGHEVVLATSWYFESLVAQAGLAFEPVGEPGWYERMIANPEMWHPKRSFKFLFLEGVMPTLPLLYDMVERFHAQGPVLVVGHILAFGARVAQEKLGGRMATINLSPAIFRSASAPAKLPGLWMPDWMPPRMKRAIYGMGDALVIDRLLAPAINRFRAEKGLTTPARGILREWWFSPDRVIATFPEWFAPRQPDWPAQTVMTGFPLYDERELQPLSPELETWLNAGSAPIAFTPGSAMIHGRSFFRVSIEASRRIGRRALLLTRHAEQIPADLPVNVRYEPYAPFSALLPRCAALVHHGGIGTTAQALSAGCPQVIMPMAHDQLDNAARITRLGVGDCLPARGYRPRRLAAVLQRLITSPTARSNAESVKHRFDNARPLDAICQAIEEMIPSAEQP